MWCAEPDHVLIMKRYPDRPMTTKFMSRHGCGDARVAVTHRDMGHGDDPAAADRGGVEGSQNLRLVRTLTGCALRWSGFWLSQTRQLRGVQAQAKRRYLKHSCSARLRKHANAFYSAPAMTRAALGKSSRP